MAKINSKNIKLNNGKKIIIRNPELMDAEEILANSRTVTSENEFMLREADEFTNTLEEEKEWINKHNENPNHLLIVAEYSGNIIGLLDFSSGNYKRIAHTGWIGMSVLKEWRGLGVGSILLQTLLDWAKNNSSIEKVCLTVHSTNQVAIGLYKKMGFKEEGRRIKDLKLGPDRYVDSVIMGLFI